MPIECGIPAIEPMMLHCTIMFIELSLVDVDLDFDRNHCSFDCISRGGRLTRRCVQTIRRRYQCGDSGVHAVSAHENKDVCLLEVERTNHARGAAHGHGVT